MLAVSDKEVDELAKISQKLSHSEWAHDGMVEVFAKWKTTPALSQAKRFVSLNPLI